MLDRCGAPALGYPSWPGKNSVREALGIFVKVNSQDLIRKIRRRWTSIPNWDFYLQQISTDGRSCYLNVWFQWLIVKWVCRSSTMTQTPSNISSASSVICYVHEPSWATMAEWPASTKETKETAWLCGKASLPGPWCISDAKVCFRAQLLRFSCTGDDPGVWYLWAYFHRWHWCSTATFKVLWLAVVSFEYSPNN